MRVIRFVVSAIAAIAFSGAALSAECNLDLKPSDGIKELSEKLKCLGSEVSSLRREVQGLKAPVGATSPRQATGKPLLSTSAGPVQVSLLGCTKTGASALCRMTLRARDDISVNIHASQNFLFDDAGRKYEASSVSVGGKRSSRESDRSIRRGGGYTLISGVDTPFDISVDSLDAGATSFSAIKLTIHNAGEATLRNISLHEE